MIRNNKGFSLVEIAIVLVIFGLILTAATSVLSLFVNKGEAERTRNMIESNKSAIYSYVATNKELPLSVTSGSYYTSSPTNDFWSNVTYPTDGYNKNFFYYGDNYLDKTNLSWHAGAVSGTGAFADISTICGATSTNTTVRLCTSHTSSNCTTYQDITNIAFVTASGGANKNIQVNLPSSGSPRVITVYEQGVFVDGYTTDMNRSEAFDDIVDWVSLDELRTRAGCDAQFMSFVNTTMPALTDVTGNTIYFYPQGGVPINSDSTANAVPYYTWKVDDIDNLVSETGNQFSFYVNKVSQSQDAGDVLNPNNVATVNGRYLILKNGGNHTFSLPQYRFDVTLTDTIGGTVTQTFIINAPH